MRIVIAAATLALFTVAVTHTAAQSGGSIGFTVKEAAGIRRTEYPVSARLALAKGALTDLTKVRLRSGETELAGQYAAATTWDDGSIRNLDVDFNLTIGASETRSVRLEYGPDVTATVKARAGLTVEEEADTIQVGNVKFGRRAWPLLASVAYRGEIIGPGSNGLTLVDAAGGRHDFSGARDVTAEVIKRGPVLVVVRYTARVPLDGGTEAPVTIICEMPNSKSWVRIRASVDDPGRRVRGMTIETPFALAAFPWTWDFGTETGTYGAFRAPADMATLTQTVSPTARTWRVETGAAPSTSLYEQSLPGRAHTATGWGHLLDTRNAVAFAMERFGSVPGTYSLSLNGQGQFALGYVQTQPAIRHEFALALHFVGTPVAIGAATSPAAMLSPLLVEPVR